jgi:hypothetical protein
MRKRGHQHGKITTTPSRENQILRVNAISRFQNNARICE